MTWKERASGKPEVYLGSLLRGFDRFVVVMSYEV